ncbi:MAG: hypothetical protein LC655_01270 [Bacteroidales bacterium]|nr:hypothetical protein [Bacteroidales bacterium]
MAHLQHLLDHDETDFVKEGVKWLKENREKLDFDLNEVTSLIHNQKVHKEAVKIAAMAPAGGSHNGGCPGSMAREIQHSASAEKPTATPRRSELKQWPVQFHLVNPAAGYFQGADLLLAADCSAYALGNFHDTYLKGKSLIIACPKLDTGQESYLQKLVQLIDHAKVNTIHVLIMEVPCCGGLMRLVQQATGMANRKVPVKATVISIGGEVLSEDWV